MLPKEKKCGGWSLAIGVVLSGTLFGLFSWQAHRSDTQAQGLEKLPHIVSINPMDVDRPHGSVLKPGETLGPEISSPAARTVHLGAVTPKRDLPPGYTETPLRDSDFVPARRPLVEEPPSASDLLRARAIEQRSNARDYSLMALIMFCLPIVWYFLLDRIREISAAVLGRDRP